jgi:MarR family transcriptional regulator, transcriptional regulator for hemolysin
MLNNTHTLFHGIHQLSRELSKELNEALEPYGLYSSQWAVLYVLKEKGTLTQKELCQYLAVEAPPMTRTIQRLLKQEYIEQHSGQDRRKKHIQLSTKALKEFPKWESAVNQANQALLTKFSDDSQRELQGLISEWLYFIKQSDD